MATPADVRYLKRCRADLPRNQGWLAPPESRVLQTLQVPKRRDDWLLGRWTVKSALRRFPGLREHRPEDWQVMAEASGQPAVLLQGNRQDIRVSLSHSRDTALCVLSTGPAAIGCDLEGIEKRTPTFEETYFARSELAILDCLPEGSRTAVATLMWSAKESVLKALGLGLRADTKRIEVMPEDRGNCRVWTPLAARDLHTSARFTGWWRIDGDMLLSVVSSDPAASLYPLTNRSKV